MDMYAEHGYIFILFLYKVNRLYIIYIKLAFRDYFFIMRQKKIFKKTTYGTVFAYHTPSTRCN